MTEKVQFSVTEVCAIEQLAATLYSAANMADKVEGFQFVPYQLQSKATRDNWRDVAAGMIYEGNMKWNNGQ